MWWIEGHADFWEILIVWHVQSRTPRECGARQHNFSQAYESQTVKHTWVTNCHAYMSHTHCHFSHASSIGIVHGNLRGELTSKAFQNPHCEGFCCLLRIFTDCWGFFSLRRQKSAQPQSAPLFLTSENFWLLKIFPTCEDFYRLLRIFQPQKSEVSSASEVSLTSEAFSDIWGFLQPSEDLYLLNIWRFVPVEHIRGRTPT